MTAAVRPRMWPACESIEKRTGAPAAVFEHPVAVTIDQAETGKQRPRPRHVVGPDGDVGENHVTFPGLTGP